jgi:hypothetical protein
LWRHKQSLPPFAADCYTLVPSFPSRIPKQICGITHNNFKVTRIIPNTSQNITRNLYRSWQYWNISVRYKFPVFVFCINMVHRNMKNNLGTSP